MTFEEMNQPVDHYRQYRIYYVPQRGPDFQWVGIRSTEYGSRSFNTRSRPALLARIDKAEGEP